MAEQRGQWHSRLGFVLAAAGAAIGLGNIWKFPYITAENGGGWFVLIYLGFIVLVGLPVMISEIIIGRASLKSPVVAYEELSGGKAIWSVVGWMGVATGFVLLSFYSIVAGWSIDYIVAAVQQSFRGASHDDIVNLFGGLAGDFPRSVLWHGVFMAVTVAIVLAGVRRGIETGVRIMMPLLFALMVGMLIYVGTLPEFGRAIEHVFYPKDDKLSVTGVLEAMGHSFFTLSVGIGTLITYGSYLSSKDDVFTASVSITLLDTMVALIACLIMFSVLFVVDDHPKSHTVGLVFVAMPTAFSQIPGGSVLGVVFFVLLFFAGLTSAISMLEIVVATVIDKFGVRRKVATVACGVAIFLYGIPSARGDKILGDWSFMDLMNFGVSNVLLPVGGLAIALFAGWVLPRSVSQSEFSGDVERETLYRAWLLVIRYFVPLAIVAILAFSVYQGLGFGDE